MSDYNNRMAELVLETASSDVSATPADGTGKRASTTITNNIVVPVIEEGQFTDAVDQGKPLLPDHDHHHKYGKGAIGNNCNEYGSERRTEKQNNRSDDNPDCDLSDRKNGEITTTTITNSTAANGITNDHDHQLSSFSPVQDRASSPPPSLPPPAAATSSHSQDPAEQKQQQQPQTSRPQVVEIEVTQAQPQAPVVVGMVARAPVLRVEKLREEDGSTTTMTYTSEEEGPSRPELSDDPEERENKLPEFVEPDKDLQDKIIKQVEFYFSDTNILKDAFLLKHVRRNKQGFVSLKLITSFRKVKSLSKDYRVVAHSLRGSDRLEVNEEGTKVRRIDPLPEYDETTPSRTVVVVNLPIENPAIESVAELFSKCGTISLIRILRPKGSIPPDVKKYSSKHPEIGTTLCAVVEFETYEAARLACSTMNNTDDWRKGMRVVPLSAKKKEKEKKKNNVANNNSINNTKTNVTNGNGTNDKEGVCSEDKKKKKGGRKKKRIDELSRENESSCYSSGSEADTPQTLAPMPSLDPNKLSPATTPKSSPRSSPISSPRSQRRKWTTKKSPLAEADNSPRISPQISPESLRKKYDNNEAPSSPWVQRRLKAAQQNSIPLNDDKNGQTTGRSPKGSPLMPRRVRLLDMEMAVRSPKGPDGTKGFYGGMGRGNIRSNTMPGVLA